MNFSDLDARTQWTISVSTARFFPVNSRLQLEKDGAGVNLRVVWADAVDPDGARRDFLGLVEKGNVLEHSFAQGEQLFKLTLVLAPASNNLLFAALSEDDGGKGDTVTDIFVAEDDDPDDQDC